MKSIRSVKKVWWRIKVPQKLMERYQLIASFSNVSVDNLVSHVLEDWAKRNKTLLMDESLPARLKILLSADVVSKEKEKLSANRVGLGSFRLK